MGQQRTGGCEPIEVGSVYGVVDCPRFKSTVGTRITSPVIGKDEQNVGAVSGLYDGGLNGGGHEQRQTETNGGRQQAEQFLQHDGTFGRVQVRFESAGGR